MDGGRRDSLVSNRRTSPLPAWESCSVLTVLFLLPPQSRNSGPRLGPAKFPESSGSYGVVTGPQCQPCEKRPLYIWHKASAGLIHGARNMLSSGRGAGKWHFNTNSLSCQPHRKDFTGREEHAEACLFHRFSPQMSREVVLGNSPRKAPFSSLLLTCQEAVACRCLTEPQSCQEVSGHSLWLRSRLPCAKSQLWQLHPWRRVFMSSTCLPSLQTPAPTRRFTQMQVTPWPEGLPRSHGAFSYKARACLNHCTSERSESPK